ncbi:transcription termination factor MTERF4, chloroplastic [Brachypodium distachyon]|uniref:Uncharacterized protein n=1 Tax=Brachypodium distachyon TaxID=15368 RepID=I1IMR8_BRADI|nr:transcription termination factor MTERF4, chloroplastic [Brachypodium distachyon]KQJ89046.1 hypothetical protein BRADI_4g23197v3 [Brachypodium distachyon]|eukprot:XP_003577739.1 transcription termination factor MTERF4, chloroplastic [Brachypodium distachyon]
MLRLRSCILSRIVSSPATSLHRLLSAAAPTVPPSPGFAVEDYLVETCGLTRPQALKASAKLSHLKSPAKPDTVLAFLAGLGLSSADVAAAVVNDPRLLCASVKKTLGPNVVGLTGLGLSNSQIARLASLSGGKFRSRSIVPRLQYYLPLFGSCENFLRRFNRRSYVLDVSMERVVKPNVAFLRECGLGSCDLAKLFTRDTTMLTSNPERVRAKVACAEGLLHVPRGSGMFRHALLSISFRSKETIAARVEYLMKIFGWSDGEASIALSRAPQLLGRSMEMLQRTCEFLISEVGLEPSYIAQRPVMINYNLEGRLRPRYYVLKFLKANGLLDHNRDYFSALVVTEKEFAEKYLCPNKEAAPHLAEDYAAACRGEVPNNFRFT